MSISRRNFLRGAGIGCSACAIDSFPPGALARNSPEGIKGKTSLTPSLCETCSSRCPTQAQVINNKTVFIQGNPNVPQQGTRVCARGGSGISLVSDPHHIVRPMKRTGPRGSGDWQVIGWEQAYREIAEKMMAIKMQHGPQGVVSSSKSGSLSGHLLHLATTFGSPNTFTRASACPAGKAIAAKAMMGGDLAMDIANTRYTVSFDHNLYGGIEVTDTRELTTAQEKGAKMVSLDPRLSVFSSKADEWHAFKPGSDLSVLMAMCHVMISENLYDADFIACYTTGFEQLAEAVQETTPEWAQQLADVSTDVTVRVTREMAACTPHAIVSPDHRATFSQEEIDMWRMIFTLNMPLGNIKREGGLYQKKAAATYNKLAGEKVAPVLAEPDVKLPKPTTQRIDLVAPQFKYTAAGGGVMQSIIGTVLNQTPYPVKGWIMSRHDPFQTVTCRPDLIKTVEQFNPVVSCDVYLSESTAYVDYLLPECTYLECDEEVSDMSGLSPAYVLRQQVIEPIDDAHPSWQIWKELAAQLGPGQFYPWQDMQTHRLYQLNGDHALSAELRQKGYREWGVPLLLREPEAVRQFVGRYLGTVAVDSDGTYGEQLRSKSPSGKIELYSEELETLLPGYGIPHARNFALKGDNELYLIQGKVVVHTNGVTQYMPLLSELMWDNTVWIHPQTACGKGIKSGDDIWLENATDKEKGKALATAGIRPDTLFVYMGFGAKVGAKTTATTHSIHCSNLLPHVTSPVSGTVAHTAGVTLRRA